MHISIQTHRKQRANGCKHIHFHPRSFERTTGGGRVLGLVLVIALSVAIAAAFWGLIESSL